MAKRLSHKEKGFVADIVRGETGTQAALNNYDTDSPHTASVIAAENLAKPRIINAIDEALPDELLNQVHREGLFATKPIYSDTGELLTEEADFNARAKYLDMGYKRKGSYAAEKHIVAKMEITISEEDRALAKRLMSLERDNG